MILFTRDGRFVYPGKNIANDGTPVRQGTMFLVDGTRLYILVDHTIPEYELSSTLQSKALTGTLINYTITLECTNNNDPGKQLTCTVPIPSGFAFVYAISNEGTYNSVTEKWTLLLENQEATLNLTLEPTDAGPTSQTVTLDGTVTTIISNTTVVSSDEDGENIAYYDVNLEDYPITLANMKNGERYTVIMYSRAHDTGVSGIHGGVKNGRFSVIHGTAEIFSNRATSQSTITKTIISFIYDSSEPITIRRYEQYQSVSTTADDRWYGLCINEGFNDVYSESTNLLSNPLALYDDTSSTTITLEGDTESGEYIFSIPVSALSGDKNPFFTGIVLQLNSFAKTSSNIEVYLKNSDDVISDVQSTYVNRTGQIVFGDSADLWGLTDNDLEETTLEVHLKIYNTSLISQDFSYSNLTLFLYYQDDETGGRRGYTFKGTHSKSYNIIVSDDDNPLGLNNSVKTLELPKTDGVMITDITSGGKEIKITNNIKFSDLEEAQRVLDNTIRWLSSQQNEYKVPILEPLILDYEPNKTYMAVSTGEIVPTKKYPWIKFETTFLVPSGAALTEEKLTGHNGTNRGLTKVRPVMVVKTNGNSSITITDTINTSLKIGINTTIPSGTILTIDCQERTIIDDSDNDYTEDISLDTVWPAIPPGEYNFTITGGTIMYLAYNEEL